MKSTQQSQKSLYVDDLKLIAKSEEELQKHIQRIKTFCDDIHMEFGLEKCAKITLKRDKQVYTQNLVTDINREIQELEPGKPYKYLGIERKIETGIQQGIGTDTEI
jgi:hypothetical protein